MLRAKISVEAEITNEIFNFLGTSICHEGWIMALSVSLEGFGNLRHLVRVLVETCWNGWRGGGGGGVRGGHFR